MKKMFRFPFYMPVSVCVFSIVIFPDNSYAQNVGIGISNPTRAKLEVNGAVGNTVAIFGGEGNGVSLIGSWPEVGYNTYFDLGPKYIGNGYGAVQFLDPNTGFMGIDMFGSGIKDGNTTTPIRALTISNNGNIGIKISPINASLCVLKAGNFDGSAVFGGTHYNSHFHYSGTEDTYIRAGKSGGNVYINDLQAAKILIGGGSSLVGINTATPVYPLEIRQTGLTGMILVSAAETYNNWEQVVGFYDAGPQSSLKLIYNGQFKSFFRPTDGEIIAVSDRRLKTNIQPLSLTLEKIMQLHPVEFEMKYDNPGHKKSIGFIAQEVKLVFPELVTVSPNTVTKGVTITDFNNLNYNSFKILTVKAVQEEQELIQNLQNRQTEITRRLVAVEKKLPIKY